PRSRIVEHAGLARGYPLFARDQFDLIAAPGRAQPGRLRRAAGSHPDKNLQPLADGAVERAVADPVDVAQRDPVHPQRLTRPDHDVAAFGVEPQHIKRCTGGDAEAPPLADGEMNDALMAADDTALEVDDVAGLDGVRPQPADDIGVAPGRHEADVLAVLLVGHRKTETSRQL